jgi:putative endonuclease
VFGNIKTKLQTVLPKKYKLNILVWYEPHATMDSAITREKALKYWHRVWKIRIIEQMNPDWKDSHDELTGKI